MYYYYYTGPERTKRGPFSQKAFQGWFDQGYMNGDEEIFDASNNLYRVNDIVQHPVKKSVTFFDETMNATNMDVTIDLNNTRDVRVNESTFLEQDFTQLTDMCDEVDVSQRANFDNITDVAQNQLRGLVSIYFDRRPLNNMKRLFKDTYIPFEKPWKSWVPAPMQQSEATQATTVLKFQCLSLAKKINAYLKSLSIRVHNCESCCASDSKGFKNEFEMLIHFLSPRHVRRLYETPNQGFSRIDVYSVEKIINEARALEHCTDEQLDQTQHPKMKPMKPHYFQSVCIEGVLASMRSTIQLKQNIPLFETMKEDSEQDECEFIEALIYYRQLDIEANQAIRYTERTTGLTKQVKCEVCNEMVDAPTLYDFFKHIFSRNHIQMSLEKLVSRADMEYWTALVHALRNNPMLDERYRKKSDYSLQEEDFPLCVTTDVNDNDYKYSGDEAKQIVKFIRHLVKKNYNTLSDGDFKTDCQWCQKELHSKLQVLNHILYDEEHIRRLTVIPNQDVRMFLDILDIPVTVPLFSLPGKETGVSRIITSANEKERNIQRLHKSLNKILPMKLFTSQNSFPLSLVNRCDYCRKTIINTDNVLPHLQSHSHKKVMMSSALRYGDFDFWWKIFF